MFVDIGVKKFNMDSFHFTESEMESYRNKTSSYFDRRGLEEYLIGQDNYLDAEKIASDFFPKVNADVFISHSHQDEEDVIKLALTLERLGLSVFVDSCIWGWANVLLRKIDNAFCLQNDGYYNYYSRNRTTANIYMILNCALQNTISQSELLLFLHTDNSIKMNVVCESDTYIASPWIFSELSFARHCQRSSRRRAGTALESRSGVENYAYDSADIKFVYPDPGTRYEISNHSFLRWLEKPAFVQGEKNYLTALNHLDKLYRESGVPEIYLEEPRSLLRSSFRG